MFWCATDEECFGCDCFDGLLLVFVAYKTKTLLEISSFAWKLPDWSLILYSWDLGALLCVGIAKDSCRIESQDFDIGNLILCFSKRQIGPGVFEKRGNLRLSLTDHSMERWQLITVWESRFNCPELCLYRKECLDRKTDWVHWQSRTCTRRSKRLSLTRQNVDLRVKNLTTNRPRWYLPCVVRLPPFEGVKTKRFTV